jgi:nitrile hydratase
MPVSIQSPTGEQIASIEKRVAAIESVLEDHAMQAAAFVDTFNRWATEEWIPENGARIVAKAWFEPDFRSRLLADGIAAIRELGLSMPAHHRHLVALENTATVHNVICCTLCSCTAFTVIGLPPDWYKDLEYRARVVRESRSVLREMGLALAPQIEIRVWDTTADTRYMVLPERPPGTEGWSQEQLAALVTKEGMIGVAKV